MTTSENFEGFPKMARYNREVIVTEKIDGSNSQIFITKDGGFFTGSRNRWITPEDDNFGFSGWAHSHKKELMALGPGRHFGEWWGSGIQRGYGLKRVKRFSLFNVRRWEKDEYLPPCCNIVPVLWRGNFEDMNVFVIMDLLKIKGSSAAPGFMNPEGVVIFHTAGNICFKKTFEKDSTGKWKR